jgi:hypothetical protein
MSNGEATRFFSDNSSLFTVLGVFGAISVYFTQLGVESRWRRLGIVSSLTIFVIVAIVIVRQLPPESEDKGPFDFVVDQIRGSKSLVVFYVGFWALVLSVVAIVIEFSNTLIFLFQFFFTILGMFLALKFIQLAEPEGLEVTLGEDPEVVILVAYVLRNSIWVSTIGGGLLTVLWIRDLIPVNDLIQFRISSLWLAIGIGISSGLLLAGLLFIVFMVMMLFIHKMFKWIIEEGLEDEISEAMDTMFGSSGDENDGNSMSD